MAMAITASENIGCSRMLRNVFVTLETHPIELPMRSSAPDATWRSTHREVKNVA